MSLMTDFPPDLDTPFNDMIAFLMRVVVHPADRVYVNQLKHINYFYELSSYDQANVLAMLREFGYYDTPASELVEV